MSFSLTNAQRSDRTGLYSMGELFQGNENTSQNGFNITLVDASGNPYSSSNPIPSSVSGAVSVKGGAVTLATNDTSKAVTFGTAFSATPVVTAVINSPTSAGFVISCSPDDSTVSSTGFTILFGAAIPASGYKLSWIATLPSS